MTVESIDKLSEYADKLRVYPGVMSWDQVARGIDSIADEIEAEISERYILLPLDADGAPIHVGDVLESGEMGHEEFTVDGIGYHDGTAFNGCGVVFHTAGHCLNGWNRFNAGICRHVKPRTIEDVLRDCCNEWNEHCGNDWEQSVYAKYADEIRGLL